jgi:sodium-independent sulfate anion transporter 11
MLTQLLFLSTGVLVDFISIPVTVGFTSATSVIIACSQLKGLLGLNFKANGFLDTIHEVWNNILETRPWDATLGFTCIVVLLLLRVR